MRKNKEGTLKFTDNEKKRISEGFGVTGKGLKQILISLIVGIVLLTIAFGSFAIVGPGERGVLITMGAVEQISLPEGLNWKIPILQYVQNVDVKTQKYEATATSASKDLQEVTTQVTVNYHLNKDLAYKVFQTIGMDYSDKVIHPAVQESVKATTARFNAEELITKRPLVKQEIEDALKSRLEVYNITQEVVSITEFTFSEKFDLAIEEKVEAEQKAFKAENDLVRIEIEAKQVIAEAKGQAGAIRARAEAEADAKKVIAEAEAYALRIKREELTSSLIELNKIDKWDGKLPQFTGGVIPFIDVTNRMEGT